MAEPDVYEAVARYLRGDSTAVELAEWLLRGYGWLEDAAPADQRELGLQAMNLGFILQSGEWTEETFRRALEREYRQALKHRPSRVS